ncbi:MAG TPA: DUF3303 family protein [Pyrinomonadaceae bacterium]|nr:DUF3303 family protein [Pyrinomonadaceae bacterium]
MLYMVIERFKNRDAVPVYQRFREQGRLMPAGLKYIESWTTAALDCCFQLMEASNRGAFQEWTAKWDDLIDFEIVPVVSSKEAVALITSKH